MRARAGEAAGVVALFLLPWLIYVWIALTGVTCSTSRFGRRESPRVATAEDLSRSFEVALLVNGVLLVTLPIAWYLRRRERDRRARRGLPPKPRSG